MRRYLGEHQEALVAYAQAHSLIEFVTHAWFGYHVRIYANLCSCIFVASSPIRLDASQTFTDAHVRHAHPYRRHQHESRIMCLMTVEGNRLFDSSLLLPRERER